MFEEALFMLQIQMALCMIPAHVIPKAFSRNEEVSMRRVIIYLTWAWEILIGILLITPGGVFCIACGTTVQAPGFIGRPATIVVGIVAIVLGVYGIVATARGARADLAAAGAGR